MNSSAKAAVRWLSRLVVCLAVPIPSALASSALVLPYPPDMGTVPAVTFDVEGRPIGRSEFSMRKEADGHYSLTVTMRISDGAQNRIEAVLQPLEPEQDGLRVLIERSQSFSADGSPMTLLVIDHEAGFASCTPPGVSPEASPRLALPADDRVLNVPMHLLLLPLARGEVERIRFQLFVCRGGARLYDFIALRGGPTREIEGRRIVEVRYGPDLGRMMSWVASRMLPRLSFWFDEHADGAYMAHRMPIYSKGPDILVAREGIGPVSLGLRQAATDVAAQGPRANPPAPQPAHLPSAVSSPPPADSGLPR